VGDMDTTSLDVEPKTAALVPANWCCEELLLK
jgi:hypothetical protein